MIIIGLYVPVLDDFEPIYEPIDRADSDLRSEPTEVNQDLCLNDPNILDPNITDPSLWASGYATKPLTETRSLTASPFVPNTKPYRPFSTEPLQVPPLDDPIILNPNYRDTIDLDGNSTALNPEDDDLLRLLPLDKEVQAKFKLPVSEKYDPEWNKKVKSMLETCSDGGKRANQQVEHELVYYSNKSETLTDVTFIKEVQHMKATKEFTVQENVTSENRIIKKETKFDDINEELNAQKIAELAFEVVEESIERAISVTENIQKEIEEERASIAKELQIDESETTSEKKIQIEKLGKKEEMKAVATKSKRTESVQHENEVLKESEHVSEINIIESKEIQEKLKHDQKFAEERKLSTKKDMEDSIETNNVMRKPSDFDEQDVNHITSHKEKKHLTEESASAGTIKRRSMVFEKDETPTKKEVLRKVLNAEIESSEILSKETLKSEDKQKAYMTGLQTIPHIKGFVQSSYHFDLLLRTFFVHLTDVMVALSRFILTQPTQELECNAEKVIKEKLINEFVEKDNIKRHEEMKEIMQSVKNNKQQEKGMRQETNVIQAKQEFKNAEVETQQKHEEMQKIKHDIIKSEQVASQNLDFKKQENVESYLEDVEVRRKSGAEMAQRTLRKSRDLTRKMDAVLTEFETKTGIEDRLEVAEQTRRRSRSRSQIEEEVIREFDPLEWLDKVDSRRASQERKLSVEKALSSCSESKVSKKSETKQQTRTSKIKPGKQMYIAIVESHVYTNKDAIFEDQVAEMSETASVQSSEEINAALEAFEGISTENVTMSNMIQNEEKQQAVELITNDLQEVVQEKQEVLEAVNDFRSEIAEQHLKPVTLESHATVAAESNEIISESKVEAFKVSCLKESKALILHEDNYKTAAVEFVEEPLETTKEEVLVGTKLNPQEALSKQEYLTTVAAETTEIIDESKLQYFKNKEVTSKQAVLSSEENYKAAAESTIEMILEASKEATTELKVKEHQAISKVESLAIAVAESTDVVVDDSKVETFESQELVSKKALVKSEETYKTAAALTEIAFETVEDTHSELVKPSEVIIKEQAQHLAVAGIIETKSELCKEPKKPAEDEYASLKIVKTQIIDRGESIEMSSQADLNIKKSLEVDISSSLQSISQSISQESSMQGTSISMQERKKAAKSLYINTNLALGSQIPVQSDEINTPSPSTAPPTPLTDEYIFRLEIPLPKNQGTVIIEDSPDREDPDIVKKGLIPYIETTIEEQIIYDPPLPTPPEDRFQFPVYTKPGLKGGASPFFKKEYIREIERKSSLLASAIDQTIKSIEEYKEDVGIHTTKDVRIQLSKKTKMREGKIQNGKEFIEETKESTQELSNEMSKAKDSMNGTDGAKMSDELPGFKPVIFNPEDYQARLYEEVIRGTEPSPVEVKLYVDESGEPLGTMQGIVDGLEDATVDEEVASG